MAGRTNIILVLWRLESIMVAKARVWMAEMGSKVGNPIHSGSQRAIRVKTKSVKTNTEKLSQSYHTKPRARNCWDMEWEKTKLGGKPRGS